MQVWLSTLTTCKHSTECTMQREFQQDHTPWPNRAEMGVRLFKEILLALVNTASKNLDHSGTNHFFPVDAQGSKGEKHTGDLKWQNAHGTGNGTKTKRSPGPSLHESGTAYIYANQAGSPKRGNSQIGSADSSSSTTTRRHPPRSC